jgi:hypothetical protein
LSKLSADANRTLAFSRPGKGKDRVYVGYGAGEDVVKVADTLVYHSAHTEFTVGDHALGRYLVHRAYRQIGLQINHSIPARDALVYLGSNHTGLIESLTRLSEGRIIISTFDDDGAPCETSCNFLDFEFHEKTGMLLFSFAIPLVKRMADPPLFALISLEKLRRFKSVTALRLFEIMSVKQHVQLKNTNFIELDLQQLHTILGDFVGTKIKRGDDGLLQELTPRTWSEYNRHVLQDALTEVNLIADFNVYAHFNRSIGRGRPVRSITFYAKIKTHSEYVDAKHGRVVSQETLYRSLVWSKKNETPAGLLKPHKRYVAPNIHNRKSPYYGCEWQISHDVMCKAEALAESAGLNALNLLHGWQDFAAKKRLSKKFSPDNSFMQWVEGRCNVAIINRSTARKDFLSISHVDPEISERVKIQNAWEKSLVFDTNTDTNQPPQYCYDTNVYFDELDKDGDPRFERDVEKAAARAYPAGLESGDSQRSADERVWRP